MAGRKKADLVPFLQSILQLKSVKRSGWVSKVRVTNPESVADHTFSMCAAGMVLSDVLRLDTEKVMKMTILHDLAESVTGDYMPGDVTARQKMQQEKKAMKSILAALPADVRSDYEKIWHEYLSNKTEVSRFVHRIDKLEMALQAAQYAKAGYSAESLDQFLHSARHGVKIRKGDLLTEILNSIKPTA